MGWHPCSWYCLSLHGRHDGAHDIEPMTWAIGPPGPCVGFPQRPWYSFMSMTTYGAATIEERKATTAYLEASAAALGITVEELCARMGYDLPNPPRKREAPGPPVRTGETDADEKARYAEFKKDADRLGLSMDEYAKRFKLDRAEIHIDTRKLHVKGLKQAIRREVERRIVNSVGPPDLPAGPRTGLPGHSTPMLAFDTPEAHRISVRLLGDEPFEPPRELTDRRPIDLDRAIEVMRAYEHLTATEWQEAWGISASTRRRWYAEARALILTAPALELNPAFRTWFAGEYPAKPPRGRPSIKRHPALFIGEGEHASPPPIPLFPSRDDAA